ncbi:beta-1,6-N-acetylglucosaminyltransferase, partial [Loigolactobacillus coryniformis]|uniref:beta-1,6-N-acetylglucosaminyltransferase n=1 Tax=Loigolactobacillus coryniformis TaxID=1610 RepID=UPI00068C659F
LRLIGGKFMHAYLIIADRNFDQLKTLLRTLDDERNDIYLLIDAKSHFQDQSLLTSVIKKSRIILVDPIKIFWGSFSQIRAELSLFKAAAPKKYEYYHLLSGLDLPLQSQDKIHAFFEQNAGKEFLTFSDKSIAEKNKINDRLDVHLFPDISSRTFKSRIGKKLYRLYRKFEHIFEHLFKIGLNKLDCPLGYGSQWVSIDHSLVEFILSKEGWINMNFKSAILCDEVFIHTLVINSKFKDRVYAIKGVLDHPEDVQGNLRYINWWDGNPHTWTIKDWPTLESVSQGNYFFSRKFDELVDKEIIEKVIQSL